MKSGALRDGYMLASDLNMKKFWIRTGPKYVHYSDKLIVKILKETL